ncbi:inorganic pyrophosphatase [Candidatus Beckwithbacteria bacterium CG23_combo_of_CG06-09_8_20_14_all_34_8]|uniref:inorganic diphosphatase n=1 Tax=Candidatus Beckwithbacteria bacterium CG23_combo_of_CG06-09_8_20_14_all_34_8 TaxID=1974497 RepID=A0A2H0B6X9_9BACT|nr:MAG: inorganic pyrophosphatase [Candidatus Beckwithbacteria bacterium CG23_combo_of_CG06-09_8_20_14_all_34_8]
MSYLACVEIPANTNTKYEMDPKSGRLFVDRFQPTPMEYPENYGYLEGVKSGDGDLADVFVLSNQAIHPGAWIKIKIIGMIDTEDEKGHDPKLLCVAENETIDRTCGKWNDITDIPQERVDRLIHFLQHHKELEPGKWVKVLGLKNKQETVEYLQGLSQ